MVRVASFAVLMLAAGCGGSIWRNAPAVQEAAGLIARLDAAARRLGEGAMDVGLEPAAGLGAWAWRDGHVGVTPALVAALGDDELAAALAHELAHLRLGGGGAPAAVGGGAGSFDVEHDADRAGCVILAARGIPPAAMVRMLRTLARGAALDLRDRIDAAARVCAAP